MSGFSVADRDNSIVIGMAYLLSLTKTSLHWSSILVNLDWQDNKDNDIEIYDWGCGCFFSNEYV